MTSFWREMMTCVIKGCKKPRDFQGHHVVSRGAGGSDGRWNRLGVCRCHHTLIEQIGVEKFVELFPEVSGFIERARRFEEVWREMKNGKLRDGFGESEKEIYDQIQAEVRRWKRSSLQSGVHSLSQSQE